MLQFEPVHGVSHKTVPHSLIVRLSGPLEPSSGSSHSSAPSHPAYLTGKPGGQPGKSRAGKMLPGGAQMGGKSRGRIQLCNLGESTLFRGPGFSILLKQGYWLEDYRASQLRPLLEPAAAFPASLPSLPTDRSQSPPPPSRAKRPRFCEARSALPWKAGWGEPRLGVGPPAPGRDLGARNPQRAHTGA